VQSATLAARHSTRAGVAAIEACLQGMRETADGAIDLPTEESELRFHNFDVGFHEAIALASGNRVLGYLLTWMAERKSAAGGVFIVATANQVSELPPELLRKGRFDEIFFVDLPDPDARVDILRLHLTRRQLVADDFALPALAAASAGFSGAEIEQAIVAALYTAHAEQKPLDTDHVMQEIRNTRPLSVIMAEPVAALREWAKERTVPAD
jgi:SpoVK/Ycf46/Vps4 family AAA+-type ATPase